jgi:hypothetical protein
MQRESLTLRAQGVNFASEPPRPVRAEFIVLGESLPKAVDREREQMACHGGYRIAVVAG